MPRFTIPTRYIYHIYQSVSAVSRDLAHPGPAQSPQQRYTGTVQSRLLLHDTHQVYSYLVHEQCQQQSQPRVLVAPHSPARCDSSAGTASPLGMADRAAIDQDDRRDAPTPASPPSTAESLDRNVVAAVVESPFGSSPPSLRLLLLLLPPKEEWKLAILSGNADGLSLTCRIFSTAGSRVPPGAEERLRCCLRRLRPAGEVPLSSLRSLRWARRRCSCLAA